MMRRKRLSVILLRPPRTSSKRCAGSSGRNRRRTSMITESWRISCAHGRHVMYPARTHPQGAESDRDPAPGCEQPSHDGHERLRVPVVLEAVLGDDEVEALVG